MAAPRVSIVMPCYQQRDFVREAVDSVLSQREVDVELLVMDPGSTDGTRAALRDRKREYGDRLILCFESDRGQSDALNRGFARARGDILGWVNSDDRLVEGALRTAVARLGDRETPAWLYGRAAMIDARGQNVLRSISAYKSWRGRSFSRWKLLTENFIPQTAVFWNRAMWRETGGLDVSRHLDMDYDLWFRFARVADPCVVPAELGAFRVHADAKGSRHTVEQLDAAYATARHYAGGLGARGALALGLHRAFSLRTRLAYRWLKPKHAVGASGKAVKGAPVPFPSPR